MDIRLLEKDDKIYINYNSDEKEINFEILDNLIEEFIKIDIKPNITISDQKNEILKSYSKLIEELFTEVKTDDFKNTYNFLTSSTDEDVNNFIDEKSN